MQLKYRVWLLNKCSILSVEEVVLYFLMICELSRVSKGAASAYLKQIIFCVSDVLSKIRLWVLEAMEDSQYVFSLYLNRGKCKCYIIIYLTVENKV